MGVSFLDIKKKSGKMGHVIWYTYPKHGAQTEHSYNKMFLDFNLISDVSTSAPPKVSLQFHLHLSL